MSAEASVAREVLDGLQHVRRLRQDDLFEIRAVGDRGVERGDAADRRVEVFEQLVGDARRQLGAEAAGQLILVRDDRRGWSARPRRRSRPSRTA